VKNWFQKLLSNSNLYRYNESFSADGESLGPTLTSELSLKQGHSPSRQMAREQHKLSVQYHQYKEWRDQRKMQNTAPQVEVRVDPPRAGDGEVYPTAAAEAEEGGGEFGRAPEDLEGRKVGAVRCLRVYTLCL
jgi:hypothetical protein